MEQAFTQAILERPEADDTWLVLADWLTESAQEERGELVRLQAELRREGDLQRRAKPEARVQELLARGVRPVVPAITNSIGMRLALVPPGLFFMGSPLPDDPEEDENNESPRHLVRITRPFFLGVTEVTQGQYRRVMGSNPSHFGPRGPGANLVRHLDWRSLPVESVSYQDIEQFCRKLSSRIAERRAKRNYRLPNEAEWEYACRGGICQSAYCFGPRLTGQVARFDDRTSHPLPVGSFPPNLFGLHDMHGNVWEWCADWYEEGYYSAAPPDDPPGPPRGHERVLRGGGWRSIAEHCRSANRGHNRIDARHNYNGFRVALSAAV
jgi:uncharacterized protein (TIGR02996 family)